MRRLTDKTAVITGTGAGIGKGIAERFASEGAFVVAVSRRKENGLPVVENILHNGGKAEFFQCDVSMPDQVKSMADTVLEKHARIDILVNNAGVNFVKPFEETTLEDWNWVINIDLQGTYLCTRAFIDTMLGQGAGSVINMTSVHTIAGLPGAAPYDAAKWGIVGMTKALAVEYAARNIRFNALSPGLIDTQIWEDIMNAAPNKEVCREYWASNIPIGRPGSVDEIASAALFLASDESSYITGANIVADGGMTAQLISRENFQSSSIEGR
jgi:NAD(P)-dependent dehydrogenase (short-subunit alcohol dehydrogenase family)